MEIPCHLIDFQFAIDVTTLSSFLLYPLNETLSVTLKKHSRQKQPFRVDAIQVESEAGTHVHSGQRFETSASMRSTIQNHL